MTAPATGILRLYPAAEALLAWERRYNHERFSMALNGLTPAEKLATFTAASSPTADRLS